MRYETYKFIIRNKKKFLYDNATTGGNDNTMDSGAAFVNPNDYLAPIAGKSGVIKILIIIVLLLLIVYLFKHTVK